MSTLDHNFNKITAKPASDKAGKSKYPPPFSIRFTFEERASLDTDRGSKALVSSSGASSTGNRKTMLPLIGRSTSGPDLS